MVAEIRIDRETPILPLWNGDRDGEWFELGLFSSPRPERVRFFLILDEGRAFRIKPGKQDALRNAVQSWERRFARQTARLCSEDFIAKQGPSLAEDLIRSGIVVEDRVLPKLSELTVLSFFIDKNLKKIVSHCQVTQAWETADRIDRLSRDIRRDASKLNQLVRELTQQRDDPRVGHALALVQARLENRFACTPERWRE